MKQLTFYFLAVLICGMTFAQTRSLDAFTKVTAQEGIEVILNAGSDPAARIEVDGIDEEEVLTDVSGGTLKIHLEGDNHRNVDVKVYVTYVSLEALKASSAASITVEDKITASDFGINCSSAGDVSAEVEAESVDINVSSSGDVDVTIITDELDINISSAGDLNIVGKAEMVDINASSSGDVDGYELECKEADLRASSGASIKIMINEDIRAKASSGASIRYKGDPKYTNVDSSSGGSVKKS